MVFEFRKRRTNAPHGQEKKKVNTRAHHSVRVVVIPDEGAPSPDSSDPRGARATEWVNNDTGGLVRRAASKSGTEVDVDTTI